MSFLSFVKSIDKKLEGVSINDKSKVINGAIATTYGLTAKLLGEKLSIVIDSYDEYIAAMENYEKFAKENNINFLIPIKDDKRSLEVRQNNSVSSFDYYDISIEDEVFVVEVYSLLNDNFANNIYIDFSSIIEKDKFVMPIGKVLTPFFEKRNILDDIYLNGLEIKADNSKGINLDHSINYYTYHVLGEDYYVLNKKVDATKGVEFSIIPEYISVEKNENENTFLLSQGNSKYKVNSIIYNNKELLDFNTMIKL